MAAVLQGRKGDAQCLKVLIAASFNKTSLSFAPVKESNAVTLSIGSTILHEPNSMMMALGTDPRWCAVPFGAACVVDMYYCNIVGRYV